MVGKSRGLVWPRQGCWMHWPPRGGGEPGRAALSVRESSPPMNSMSLCRIGHFADNIFWGQAGIGADGLSGCVFVPLCHPGAGMSRVQKELFT